MDGMCAVQGLFQLQNKAYDLYAVSACSMGSEVPILKT